MSNPCRLSALVLPAVLSALPVAPAATAPAAAGPDFPAPVTSVIDPDAAMARMENPVNPAALETFKKQHPAKFWVFGEDRQYSVRNSVIPAHWFEDGAKAFQHFSGVAQPGEFYVFQACVLRGANSPRLDCSITFDELAGTQSTVLSDSAFCFPARDDTGAGLVPFWIGLQIPANARPGTYRGQARFTEHQPPDQSGSRPAEFNEHLSFAVTVAGPVLDDSGTKDPWRLARLKWLNSTVGTSNSIVTRPFEPVRFDARTRTLEILGRRVTLGNNGIPTQVAGFFSGSNTRTTSTARSAFRAPPTLDCIVAGKTVAWQTGDLRIRSQSPVAVHWESSSTGGGMTLHVDGQLEYDGYLRLAMDLRATPSRPSPIPVQLDDVRFVVPWNTGVAKYAAGLGLRGGPCPNNHDWKWDVSKHQDAVWLGDVNIGAMMRFKGDSFRRPLINAYYDFHPLNLPESWGSGGVRIENANDTATLTAYSGPKTIAPDSGTNAGKLTFQIDWYFTPFKPIDVKGHFTDRYYHATQGTTADDAAALRQEGVNIIEIHHNRPGNPYLNYPYNEDSFPHLREFVKKAHADGVRVNLYYTTRELTQNLPEFFALKSMGGEIILPRKDGVAWPVTNPNGPHPWLLQHVGPDIVPAWREILKFPAYKSKLDLAVITTPDSRWNNFYLAGLDYLVKQAGIDGLYIDDTALDRKSMQRARRILDADGNTGRRISMHSWNHFNGLAKWSNSSIVFMELYPYYDGLWHGEGFDANESPEFMLVEMSGIPFGLMGEMLDHPNPWHGMVFGMRVRWPWSGDPRNLWKLEDQFGIAGSNYLGWWDPACPVKVDNPKVKASVYQKNGSTLIALASWAPAQVAVKLTTDWPALGLAPGKVRLRAPACAGFQPAATFAADAAIAVEPNKGWLLIADESTDPPPP